MRAYMSFGGGVQSTAIAMLAINKDERLLRVTGGLVPEMYVFADTGEEAAALYPHVADIQARIEATGAHFETVRTPLGGLGDHIIRAVKGGFKRAEQLPFWVRTPTPGVLAPVEHRCTRHFKINACTAFARSYFGIHRGKAPCGNDIQLWLGISRDEPQRLRAGPIPKQEWSSYRCVLYEMGWHRSDCATYLLEQGITPARSACVFCPYHDMSEWRAIHRDWNAWLRVLEIDDALAEAEREKRPIFGFDSPLYLNKYGVRMRDLDLMAQDDPQRSLWNNECSGVCGV